MKGPCKQRAQFFDSYPSLYSPSSSCVWPGEHWAKSIIRLEGIECGDKLCPDLHTARELIGNTGKKNKTWWHDRVIISIRIYENSVPCKCAYCTHLPGLTHICKCNANALDTQSYATTAFKNTYLEYLDALYTLLNFFTYTICKYCL